MDTIAAFANGMANSHRESMVFDWDKAAQLIAERGASNASAGLAGDWEWTGGDILRDGLPVPADDACVYLASTWATPQLCIDGEVISCYRMASETPGWSADTYWPDSARALLGLSQES